MACPWGSLTARFSQHGRVFAEEGLSEELSGAPDSLVDLCTGEAYTECTHEIGAAPDTIGLCCVNLDAANARVGDVVGRAGERVSFTLRYASGAE